MAFGPADRGKPRIGVVWMALALVVAAFLGGALGLVWQSASFFSDEEEEVLTTESPEAD